MHEKERFGEMLIFLDTCQAETMFSAVTAPGVTTLASSRLGENSYAFLSETSYLVVPLMDRFTFAVLEFFERQGGHKAFWQSPGEKNLAASAATTAALLNSSSSIGGNNNIWHQYDHYWRKYPMAQATFSDLMRYIDHRFLHSHIVPNRTKGAPSPHLLQLKDFCWPISRTMETISEAALGCLNKVSCSNRGLGSMMNTPDYGITREVFYNTRGAENSVRRLCGRTIIDFDRKFKILHLNLKNIAAVASIATTVTAGCRRPGTGSEMGGWNLLDGVVGILLFPPTSFLFLLLVRPPFST